MNNNQNQSSYLRTSRQFPNEIKQLGIELDRSYIDIANAVNNRMIGIFPSNAPAVTGETWFLRDSPRQQTFRKIYSFGPIAPGTELDIPIDITTGFVLFTRIYATVITTVIDYRPIPYVDPSGGTAGMTILVGPVAGQLQIRIVLGATAAPVTSGIAVLEYLSNI